MSAAYTPMIEQYRDIKRAHQGEILFFRLGDFYEMFFEDAVLAAKELEITLTSRDGGTDRVPMCGVPFHAAENYIAKLVAKGYKVAICEQVEDPKQVKGIVRREVVKIVTPGTFMSDQTLAEKTNQFLVLLYEAAESLGVAAADISTGEMFWTMMSGPRRSEEVCDLLAYFRPAELVIQGRLEGFATLDTFLNTRLPECARTPLLPEAAQTPEILLERHFTPAELPEPECARLAVAWLLHYLHSTVKSDLSHINTLVKHTPNEYLLLDASTQRNLEITRNMRDQSKKDTLLSVLDFTKTAMGGRLLRRWLEQPLVNRGQIMLRQDAVAELYDHSILRKSLQTALASVYDLERILAKIEIGTANARDLVALKTSLGVLPDVRELLQNTNSRFLKAVLLGINTHADIVSLITAAIVDAPPLSVRDGGMIRAGYDLELDELRTIALDTKQWIQSIEAREREQTGIRSLKVGYNKVFGYYIEITNAHTANAPAHYIRKQTLVNAERYITPELKEFEAKILGAQEKIVNIEYHIFSSVRDYIKERIRAVQETARQIARLDAVLSLSEAAARYNYIRPIISSNREIIVRDGRHPVVERLLTREMFVPNDTALNHQDNEIMLITGPNMAGKSTYMRQVALLVLMAQTGSFIPAREAIISPVDRIFTRVGASDDLATGQSTFMVEMNEVAHILKYATSDSLIILDEIGRGTSTFDGMSIARAVLEYIKDRIKAKTLFATHYHELTDLADHRAAIQNYRVAVKERGNEVVFLHRIVPGSADKSYGIHVAQLAGLPKKIIDRAHELLHELESSPQRHGKREMAATTLTNNSLSLFQSTISDELLKLDIMSLTPLEALNILYKLQQQAKEEAGKP
ncbi:MAG: DNA mismatch repair protein MutS [Negativicutes bacterium]|nr:DNA mismatch repair protein MutS [Negativicutes bacterium]